MDTRLERLAEWDGLVCRRFNRMGERDLLRIVLAAASRLGNGIFWYLLMLALLANGASAAPAVVHMLAAGIVCTLVYKTIKRHTTRRRPCDAHTDIVLLAAPLDRYSFPSGHTLHAVAFTLVATAYYPALVWILAPFTVLVALSRVVLGLHYPSDVLAGAAIGALIAKLTLLL